MNKKAIALIVLSLVIGYKIGYMEAKYSQSESKLQHLPEES